MEEEYIDDGLESTLIAVNKEIFGFDSFRPNQLEIVKAVMRNEDVFVIMPTGGGKSLCYALPAVLSCGVTVVISPLISLIEDQVSGFNQLSPSGHKRDYIGIPSAYLTSTCSMAMIKSVYEDLSRGRKGLEPFLKLLYITPEGIVKGNQIKSALQDLYQNEMLARIIIDEAHCVSSWGHDFRKDYGILGILKDEYPSAPIVALTATARPKVADDIVKLLKIPGCRRISSGFNRTNLLFEVHQKPKRYKDALEKLLNFITNMHKPTDTGIVYCMTKKECEATADFLRDHQISADYYHAGQSKKDRRIVQGAWLSGAITVVCATIAYGMGIDKRDVRYVVHMSLAKSLEGYYQEAGRAGRDGLLSSCVVFYDEKDVSALERIMKRPPARRLSKRDSDMLQEMQDYCTSSNCRRKSFYDIFNERTSMTASRSSIVRPSETFVPCGNMCDICRGKKADTSSSGSSLPSITDKPSFKKASAILHSGVYADKHLNQKHQDIVSEKSEDEDDGWISIEKRPSITKTSNQQSKVSQYTGKPVLGSNSGLLSTNSRRPINGVLKRPISSERANKKIVSNTYKALKTSFNSKPIISLDEDDDI